MGFPKIFKLVPYHQILSLSLEVYYWLYKTKVKIYFFDPGIVKSKNHRAPKIGNFTTSKHLQFLKQIPLYSTQDIIYKSIIIVYHPYILSIIIFNIFIYFSYISLIHQYIIVIII